MAFLSFSMPLSSTSTAVVTASASVSAASTSSSSSNLRYTGGRCSLPLLPPINLRRTAMVGRRRSQIVCMAPEEEKMTRRSPLDFPIEWERPKPGRRPDIFPQFSPMKTPLPPPSPADPPEEDEEEEEKKEEEEEDPENEEPDKPENQ
ncbi:hypothetical protein HHK36_006164 [Tetracentron sinense]|uniref:Uncharacterized protein n=1 Tax=Tetracentron sinense TaxID=13715 RepID=A0A834ZGQ5_TETSI|nr:hypothetical protein HHK36_006164 [Tetracentron sinense]